MKFCWCTIIVKDMEKSLKFYQEVVGIPLNKKYPAGPGMEIAFLGHGETQVELIFDSKRPSPGNIEGISIGFEVKSVDEMIKFVEAKGIKVQSGPIQPNPHIKFFYVKDPDGVNVQFVENI